METPPIHALAQLAAVLLHDRTGAWCRLDRAGIVVQQGGDWLPYGSAPPPVGQRAALTLLALEGLLPTAEALKLSSMDLGAGRSADLHVIPIEEGYWIWLLDCSAHTEEVRHWQQLGHEADLLGADLAKQTLRMGRRNPASFPADRGLFLWNPVRGFRLQSPMQPWLQPFVEATAKPKSVRLAAQDPTSFLGNFLVDARQFFAGTQPGSLASGEWDEVLEDGVGMSMEAVALMDASGECGLILQHLGPQPTHDQELLQGVRESSLTLERLRTETHKKEVLLQCIVHDLRGPLSSMSAVLSLLGRQELAPDKREKLLEVAQRQAQRQDEMMREVLSVFASEIRDLQRVERAPERAPDLCAVARSTAADRLPSFQENHIELLAEIPDGALWKVPGHGDKLGRVIGNLLDNALRFAPTASSVRLEIREVESGRAVELHVLDRGPGVPSALQAGLFQRFSQAGEPSESPPGSSGTVGLGLFFCRTSVEAWGGCVGYSERAGGGADFWLRLPVLGIPS